MSVLGKDLDAPLLMRDLDSPATSTSGRTSRSAEEEPRKAFPKCAIHRTSCPLGTNGKFLAVAQASPECQVVL